MESENPPREQTKERTVEPRNGKTKVQDAVGQHLAQLTSDYTPFIHDSPKDN